VIFLVQGWADFVDWLGGGPAAQALAASVTLIVTAALAVFTFLYARSAGRQAEAAFKMAEEMREQRYAASRPLMDAVFLGLVEGDDIEQLKGGLVVRHGQCPETRRGYVQNFGLGPALDVEVYVKGPEVQPYLRKVGALGVGQAFPPPPESNQGLLIWLEPIEGTGQSGILRIRYRDIYGREIESTRLVTAERDADNDEATLRIGPLETRVTRDSQL